MPQLTLSEKLEVIFGNLFSHPLFFLLLIVPVLYFIFNKKGKIFYIISFIILLLLNYEFIFSLFDSLVNYLINITIFPSTGIVLFVVILSLLILIFSKRKILSAVFFTIIQILFAMFLFLVKKHNLDLLNESSLYSLIDVITIMQMIIVLFFIELLLLFFNKCVDVTMNKLFPVKKKYILNKQMKVLKKHFVLIRKNLKTYNIKKYIETPKHEILVPSLEEAPRSILNIEEEIGDEYKPNEAIKAIVSKALVPKKIKRKHALNKKYIKTLKRKYVLNKKYIKTLKRKYILNKKCLKPLKKKSSLLRKNNKTLKKELTIKEISREVNNINVKSNKYITKETKRKMTKELLEYKEKLLKIRQEEERKNELRKQMEDFSSMFNITKDDLKG